MSKIQSPRSHDCIGSLETGTARHASPAGVHSLVNRVKVMLTLTDRKTGVLTSSLISSLEDLEDVSFGAWPAGVHGVEFTST